MEEESGGRKKERIERRGKFGNKEKEEGKKQVSGGNVTLFEVKRH